MFQSFLVSKFLMNRRLNGGGHHGFIEIFLSHRTETKNVVREPFCVPENIWYGKKLYGSEGMWGGEGVSRFPSKFSRLTVSKKIRRGTLLCFKSFLIWQNF